MLRWRGRRSPCQKRSHVEASCSVLDRLGLANHWNAVYDLEADGCLLAVYGSGMSDSEGIVEEHFV